MFKKLIDKIIAFFKRLFGFGGGEDPVCPTQQVPKDFKGVVWLHTNVSGWAQTANLRTVIHSNSVEMDYNKSTEWRGVNTAGALVNANPWIFVYRDGKWYAATWEWMRHGQTVKSKSAVNGNHIKVSPLNKFTPVMGETYGFMISGLARTNVRNVKERSNVVMVKWV
jgi:hypothetical protein